MAETGILDIIGIAVSAWKNRNRPKEEYERFVADGLWIGNMAFLIHNLTESTLFVLEMSLLWWVDLRAQGLAAKQNPYPKTGAVMNQD